MGEITAQRTSVVPLTLVVDSSGGVAGLSTDVRIRDGATVDSYLDWDDLSFKTTGWTLQRKPLTEVGGGFYQTTLDLGTISNLPDATTHLFAEFRSQGAVPGAAVDTITLTSPELDEEVDIAVTQRQALRDLRAMARGRIVRTNDDYAYKNSDDSQTLYTNRDGDDERSPV